LAARLHIVFHLCTCSTFTKGICSSWIRFDLTDLFKPLENAIGNQLIPALVGRRVSDAERQMLALPLKHGGLALLNPQKTAELEYENSSLIAAKLTYQIFNQNFEQHHGPATLQNHQNQNTTAEGHNIPKVI